MLRKNRFSATVLMCIVTIFMISCGGGGDGGSGGIGGTGGTFKLPDAGQIRDYTTTFGEDSDYSINPISYTDNGDGTVTDNVTGLMWQREDDGLTYNWYHASGTSHVRYNNYAEAVDVCGNLTLAGYTGWRLPTKKELMSIMDYGKLEPAINTTYFPNTHASGGYWSSTTLAHDPSYAWNVFIHDGYIIYREKTDYNFNYVRCVRGNPYPSQNFSDNGDGTVTDVSTGLMWQREDDDTPRTWEQSLTYCEEFSLAGHSDWRLPDIRELESVTYDAASDPAINSKYFPNTKYDYAGYWSSTVFASTTVVNSWVVYFTSGMAGTFGMSGGWSYDFYVRCVRGG